MAPFSIDKNSGKWAIGVCLNAGGGILGQLVGGSICVGYFSDTKEIAVQHSRSYQGTTSIAGGGVMIGIQTSVNANKPNDFEGPFGTIGGTVGAGEAGGADFAVGKSTDENGCPKIVDQENVSFGLGAGADIHGGISATTTDSTDRGFVQDLLQDQVHTLLPNTEPPAVHNPIQTLINQSMYPQSVGPYSWP